ncbi:molybdopterin-guanine dinucleotide biosynthesis protein B [Dehalobacter sp. DCM]|uniref:molybdopterin-guanine dinucleotide biosynthesis protein B n=1 Tax=Dehalobacter sp. DCM TaxID=2907827 RepID=UPI0030814438|nr:molybdopterin-guanine dinucleotide biosynthesis protein B [Dehalobacter sp. DCM]
MAGTMLSVNSSDIRNGRHNYHSVSGGDTGNNSSEKAASAVPVVCFVAAKSGTGKTTFLEKLIREMTERGYRIGVIKSDAHRFDIDKPGKDSWRFAEAGSTATAIIGPDKYAVIQKTETKKDIEEVIPMIENVDIILVEGFKMSQRPRFEVVRRELGTEIVSPAENLLGVITDVEDLAAPVPLIDLNDYVRVADIIISVFNLNQ